MSKHTPGPLEAIGEMVRTPLEHGGFLVAEFRDGFGLAHTEEAKANARLFVAADALLEASINALDMLSIDRQSFVDCQRLRDSRTEDPIAHGLVFVDEETWINPEDAEALRDYDRALGQLSAAIAAATGQAGEVSHG